MSVENAPDATSLGRRARGPLVLGSVTVLLFFGAFGAWATLAPLAGGAIAEGSISPEGSRRTVQHFEGGIVAEILVRDGDLVEAGDPLLVFEDVAARSRVDMLLSQRWAHQANLARLAAEDRGHEAIAFPEEMLALRPRQPNIATLIVSQEEMLRTRRARLAAEKRMLRERIHQIDEETRGLAAQVESADRQLAIIAEEIADKSLLVERNLMPKPQLLALQRLEAEILGDRGEYEAQIARAKQQISETELQLATLDAEQAEANAKERDERLAALAEIDEELTASNDVLRRTVLPAPITGRVLDLRFKTRGGVVGAGEPVLELVPVDEELIVEAQVSPQDIDVVHPGLEAKVRLLAFSNRTTPEVTGVVRSVSADIMTAEDGSAAYYLARIEVDRGEFLKTIGEDTDVVPGMPAQVLIISEHRTLLNYLTKPITDAFNRSFREV